VGFAAASAAVANTLMLLSWSTSERFHFERLGFTYLDCLGLMIRM
jgi:hypothetical protein